MKTFKNMELEVFTDAGFKDGLSTHNWLIFDKNTGKRVKRLSFKANEETSMKAELRTINSVLQYLMRRDVGDLTINTDCKQLVNMFLNDNCTSDIKLMKWQMKDMNIDIKWVSRETKEIKMADFYCSQLMETVLNREVV